MTNIDITDKIASTHLGQKSAGSIFYDPSLLVVVPRENNRVQYNIDEKDLCFKGFDVWHAYEFSVLTKNGLPVTRVLKLRYSCESPFIVESKSLKLYLNSFNMSQFGDTIASCLTECEAVISVDLSKKLHTDVSVQFLNFDCFKCEIFNDFVDIMSLISDKNLIVDAYKESPQLLKIYKNDKLQNHFIRFDSLRSNCRVTHQPDFADVFVYYKSKKIIEPQSLLKYLVSFRSEYHFHEECCEMIYKRLFDLLNEGDELFISCLYTRRGGIDICPTRMSENCTYLGAENLFDLNTLARFGIKQ